MDQPLVKVNGFAPRGLVKLLTNMNWSKGNNEKDGDFQNFDGICLGGYCLATPADNLAPMEFRVLVTEFDDEDPTKIFRTFEVTGFCFRDTARAMTEGLPIYRPNTIFLHELTDYRKGLAKYTMELFPLAKSDTARPAA